MKQIFPYGKPVTGKELIDRKDIVKNIINDLKGSQSIILTSPRRYGKSSVIYECLKRLKKAGYFIGYIDLFEKSSLLELAEGITETTLENNLSNTKKFIHNIKTNLSKVIKNTQYKHIWQDNEFILSFGSSNINESTMITESLDFPEKYSKKNNKKMILAFDEFGDLKNWNEQIYKKMRAKFQRHKNVTYIFAGSQESIMKELFTNKKYAFYGFGKIIELGPLPEPDLNHYFFSRFKKANISIDKDLITHLCSLTNNHPHYSKILAQATLEQIEGKKIITKDNIIEGYNRAFLQVKGEIDKEWENLSKATLQRRVLKFLAQKKGAPYSKYSFPGVDKQQIYFALTELQNKGIIIKTGKGEFSFANPFFIEYILRMYK